MARLGDGWMLNYRTTEQARPALDKLDQYLEDAGRDRTSFGIEPRLNMSLVGPDGWIGLMQAWEQQGATHLMVNTMGCGYETTSAHINALKHFAELVGLSK
jgi:hypothetical protein